MADKDKKIVSVNELSAQLGKLPPQAVDMEEGVLGALLLEKDALDIISFLKPEDFYKESHQEIFKAVINLFAESKPVDILTVTAKLRENGKLEMAGGAYYVTDLTTRINSAAHIETHARLIQEARMKRDVIHLTSEAQRDAYDDTQDVFDILDRTDRDLMRISEQNSSGIIDVGDFATLNKRFSEIEQAKKKRLNNEFVGIPSGMVDLDRKTGGFKNSDLIIIAARPGMAKTALAGTIARNNAIEFRNPVGIFSLEMSSEQLINRFISGESEVSSDKIANGDIEDYEFQKILQKSDKLLKAPIYIDDTPSISILQLRAKARVMKKRYGIKILIVDYLQLMKGDQEKKSGNREQEIASISRALKGVAKELNIPVIALSQLSRAVETRGGDKRPMLSDLRESGSIEQDADMVMFLYRPEYYGFMQDENGMPTNGLGEVMIEKFRNGSTGSVWLKFIGKYTKWEDLNGPVEVKGYVDPPDKPSINAFPQANEHSKNRMLPSPDQWLPDRDKDEINPFD